MNKTNQQYLLALDYGTQSIRALLFDCQGQLHHKVQRKVKHFYSPQPGWAEQDAEESWRLVTDTISGVWDSCEIRPEQVVALSVTTQRNCVVHLDESLTPMRPMIMWPDNRRATELPPISWYWQGAFRLVGIHQRIRYFQQESEINWVAQHQPTIAETTRHICFLSGYLHYRLTNRLADSTAAQVGYIPFDYKTNQWCGKGDWRWQAIAARPEQMIELVHPGEELGGLCEDTAKLTGLSVDLPVIAAGADKACETLAAGGADTHIACVSLGTAATVSISQAQYKEAYRYLPPYPSLLEQQHINEIQLQRGFWLFSHFIETYGQAEIQQANEAGVSPESLICSQLNNIPAGCDGLTVLPYWSPGVIFPGPEARGAIVGFSPHHGRLHLYRALIEGILFALKTGLERLKIIAPVPITLIRISGGGAQSDEVLQIAADILGLPCERLDTFETSGLGASIAMAKGIGHYPNMTRACEAMVTVKDRFIPDPDTSQLYRQLYQAQAKDLYARLKPGFQRLLGLQLEQ